jgi:hypothetical protein
MTERGIEPFQRVNPTLGRHTIWVPAFAGMSG